MKVVYSTCCGVDVHKTFLVATIIKTYQRRPAFLPKKTFLYFQQ